MPDASIERERAQNIWGSFARKVEAVAQATTLEPIPEFPLDRIAGLDGPKEEIQTFACAVTSPKVYERWGTYPPSGLLLIGRSGVGKTMLARGLASLSETSFLTVGVPRLVIEMIHRGGKVGELISGWSAALAEMPPVTLFFEELEFSQAREIGANRPDLPVGPVMDLLLDLVDRSIASDSVQAVASTSHPETLRQAFAMPGRFERVIEVAPVFPTDIVAALELHAEDAEKRAGHQIFADVDWTRAVGQNKRPSTGDWVRILHAVLRRKARCESSGDASGPVTTADLEREVRRFQQASDRLATPHGTYV